MKNRRINPDIWPRAREDWVASSDTIAAIAARHGISGTALSRHANAHDWPPRGSAANDPAVLAQRLYADITHELRSSLRTLQSEGTDEGWNTAAQRASLIRAHRRALIALLDARKPLAGPRKPSGTGDPAHPFPSLDLEAARKDILSRLERLDKYPPPDLACHEAVPRS